MTRFLGYKWYTPVKHTTNNDHLYHLQNIYKDNEEKTEGEKEKINPRNYNGKDSTRGGSSNIQKRR